MASYNFYDGYIYDQKKQVAVKLYDRTIYMGYLSPILKHNNCFEIFIMQSQSCKLYINENAYNISKGDLLVFSSNDPCELKFIDTTSVFTVLQIHCNNFLNIIPKSMMFDELGFLNTHNVAFQNHIPHFDTTAQHISNCIDNAKKEFIKKQLGYEFFVLQQILSIVLDIAKNTNYCSFPGKSTQNKRNAKPDIAFKKAIDYIDNHLSEDLTLEKISEIAGLTPNYFSNIFRKQTGVKLWDYITEKRIALSTKLLAENPQESVISIALKCGFNNCPNFNRAFKKYTGQTPKKYKTSVLRQEYFYEKQ